MTFRTMMRPRTLAGAFAALAMVAGSVLSSTPAYGDLNVTLNPIADQTVFTAGGVLPPSLFVATGATIALVEGSGSPPLQNGGVTFGVQGGLDINIGTSLSANSFVGTVDLIDSPNAASPGYTTTVQAIATADDYYSVSQLGSASQDVMVTINDSTPVDSDGDSMPNANELEGIVSSNSGQITFLGTGESGASLTTHLTTLTANPTLRALIVSEDYYTSGVTYNLFFTAPTLSAIHAAAGYYDTVLDATEAIIFATVSLVSGDLTVDEGDDPAMAIPGVEDVFVRLIILHNGLGSGIWTSIDALSSSTMIFLTVETTGLDEDITRVLQYIKPLDLVTSGEGLTFMDAGSWSDADDSASTADLRDVGNVTPTGFSSIFTDLGLMAWDVNPDVDPPVEPPTSGGSSSTCLIATAAYGTPMAEEINTLRAVRDTYMLNNIVGTAFVDAYYRLSPSIADKVAESPLLAAVVRAMLTPFILVGKLILSAPMALMALMLAGAGLVLAHRRTRGSQS